MQLMFFCCIFSMVSCANATLVLDLRSDVLTYDQAAIADVILQPVVQFYPEIEWLFDDVDNTGEALDRVQTTGWRDSIAVSKNILPELFSIEFERTASSVVSFYLIWDGSRAAYDFLVQKQNAPQQLSWMSFIQLHHLMHANLHNHDEFMAMLSTLIYSDLGKTAPLQQRLKESDAGAIKDHDDAIRYLFSLMPKDISYILPSYDSLSKHVQSQVQELMTAVPIHWGHLAHLEGGARMFESLLLSMQSQSVTQPLLEKSFLLQIFDVAGALGHVCIHGSLTLTEQTYQNYKRWLQLLKQFLDNPQPQEALKAYLETRCNLLELDCQNAENQILARFACMLRLFNKESGEKLKKSAQKLNQSDWSLLKDQFSLDGGINAWQRNPTYVTTVMLNFSRSSGYDTDKILRSGLCLAKIFKNAAPDYKGSHEPLNFNLLAATISRNPKFWRSSCSLDRIAWQNHQVTVIN